MRVDVQCLPVLQNWQCLSLKQVLLWHLSNTYLELVEIIVRCRSNSFSRWIAGWPSEGDEDDQWWWIDWKGETMRTSWRHNKECQSFCIGVWLPVYPDGKLGRIWLLCLHFLTLSFLFSSTSFKHRLPSFSSSVSHFLKYIVSMHHSSP